VNFNSVTARVLFSTIRIDAHNGKTGSIGTGFLFQVKREENEFLFIITNRHVVEGCTAAKFSLTRAKGNEPAIGKRTNINIPNDFDEWWQFPNDPNVDLAVAPFAALLRYVERGRWKIFCPAVPEDTIPNRTVLSILDCLEPIFFVGYPTGLYDHKNNLPIFRQGTTATPLEIDFEGKKQFLIDAAVFPGSSGSPVFWYPVGRNLSEITGGLYLEAQRSFFFLGILTGGFIQEEKGSIVRIPIPTTLPAQFEYHQMINLGWVIKASVIVDFIDELIRKGIFVPWKVQTTVPR